MKLKDTIQNNKTKLDLNIIRTKQKTKKPQQKIKQNNLLLIKADKGSTTVTFVVRRLRHPHNLGGEGKREVRDATYAAESPKRLSGRLSFP